LYVVLSLRLSLLGAIHLSHLGVHLLLLLLQDELMLAQEGLVAKGVA
jgi:hypothetical protein